jgi:aspartyl-tRNA(Asn)/glutamyl-tRNA(Gln) amidotransferase subunit A
MDADEIIWASAGDLAARVRERTTSVAEIAEAMIGRIEAVNPGLNAIVHFDPEQVRRDAAALDAAVEAGEPLGPLHGVPYTIKDLSDVAGLPTTYGIKAFAGHIAEEDANLVVRMKAAGGLFLGKTNTPEMGYYGGTDNHLFGPTHNPWKHGHSAGGSSGGAAAATVAGMGPLAHGSDGAGSIRIPAALCGAVGIKPTTGVVPGSIPFADWVYNGPITRTVDDCALMLDVVAGFDPTITPSVDLGPASYATSLSPDVAGLRVAYSPDMGLGVHVDPEVEAICREVVEVLAGLGAEVTEASPAFVDPSVTMWHAIWVPTYAGIERRFEAIGVDAATAELDDNLHELLAVSKQLSMQDFGLAFAARGAIWAEWTRFMGGHDVLVSPTLASATFPLEQFAPSWLEGTSLREQLLDWLLTYPYNMLNAPAMTVPGGFTADGRPVGFQIAARHWQDARILGVAKAVEQARPWADRRPEL